MSCGYLIVADVNLDELQKQRYMKFEKTALKGRFHAYVRMEYLNQQYQLIDMNPNKFLCLTEYGIAFFEGLKRGNVYFVYFLLAKHVSQEDVIDKAFKTIASPAKIPALDLREKESPEIQLDQLYRVACAPSSWPR